MSDESALRERLRKIEALFAGAGTAGERSAAEAARDRLRARLAELSQSAAPIEIRFALADPWSRRLFLALCRRYGLKPYRNYRQRVSSVMLRAPMAFVEQVLWPEFEQLNAALTQYLSEVTERVIREEVHRDTSEAAEMAPALPGG
jgi:tRNA nucleotidyltransferase (CCA-adding enzyme)